MHAWATVSHHLDYKQDVDIPSSLKKDFYALSGIFYVADSLFEQFRVSRTSSLTSIVENARKDVFDLKNELNLDTMPAYLSWKLPDRDQDDMNSISNLLTDLNNAQIKDYDQLNKILDGNMAWLLDDEKRSPPVIFNKFTNKRLETTYSAIGVIRWIIRTKLGLIP